MRRLPVLLIICLFFSLPGWAQVPDCAQVSGWSQDGQARSYEPDNLYDYMNGNAEGYLIYRFAKLNGITCKCGEDTIVIDISEMADPEYAYGIFLANRDPRQPTGKIGMAGQVLPRKATFAKDKYYVELSANPAKDHTASLEKYVALIEKSISGRSEPPAVVGWFPSTNMVPNSLRLIPQSVLGLRILKSGYTAQYDFGKAFIVRETSSEAAKEVFAKLKERVGTPVAIQVGEEGFSGTDKYLDGMWVFRKGAVIAGFANLKEARDMTALATEFGGKIE